MYSLPFMVAFLLFFTIYVGMSKLHQKWKTIYILLFSLFFAYKANGILMLLLLAVTLGSWYLTRLMMKLHCGRPRRLGLAFLILLELSPLFYYKYTNFASDILNALLQTNFAAIEMILPVGISFYTFQSISYTVDVYKLKFPANTNFTD